MSCLILSALLLGLASSSWANKDVSGSCPTDFDPDNSGWFLTKIEEGAGGFIYIRFFLYQPDPAKRLNPKDYLSDCFGLVYSISFGPYLFEQRVLKILKNPMGATSFLLTENKEWKSGAHVNILVEMSQTDGNWFVLTLHDSTGAVVVERKIPVPKEAFQSRSVIE